MTKEIVMTEQQVDDLIKEAYIEGYKAAGEVIRLSADMRLSADLAERIKKGTMQ